MKPLLQPTHYLSASIIYFLLILFSIPTGVAQTSENDKILLKEVDALISLSNKQIKKENKVSEELRAEMLKLIAKLGYEESYIIGETRQYWKEGLSNEFKSAPKPLIVNINGRNQQTVQLENTHVALYESDRRLLLWKKFKNQCEQIESGENTKFFRDVKKYNSSNLKNTLLCYLLDNANSKRSYPYTTELLAKRDRQKGMYGEYLDRTDYTNLDSIIEKAYPYDGQVNFFKDEFVREFGFILLKNGYQEILKSGLAIRWTNERGRTIEKEAKYDYDVQAITFDLPKPFLKPGGIYKYQILSTPQEFNNKCKYEILDHALSEALSEYLQSNKLDGKVIYEAYFRCSHYASFIDKIDAIADREHALSEDFKLVLNLSEPFSEFELVGDDTFKPQLEMGARINSNVTYPKGLYSIELKRMLTTPKDLTVDTLDMEESLESLKRKYKEYKAVNEKRYYDVDYLKELKLEQIEFQNQKSYTITKEDFNDRKRFDESHSYEITFPMVDSLSQVYTKAQNALKERINKRAEFFRLIDIKIKKIENDPTRHPIEYYIDLENAKLSDTLKKFMEIEMSLGNERKCGLDLMYHLPGLEQKTAIHRIEFDLQKKIE